MPGNLPPAGRAQPLGQRVDILDRSRHPGVDVIGHPAGQRQTGLPDRLRRQQGVVQAAQAYADHQHDRHSQNLGKIGTKKPPAPSTTTLSDTD